MKFLDDSEGILIALAIIATVFLLYRAGSSLSNLFGGSSNAANLLSTANQAAAESAGDLAGKLNVWSTILSPIGL